MDYHNRPHTVYTVQRPYFRCFHLKLQYFDKELQFSTHTNKNGLENKGSAVGGTNTNICFSGFVRNGTPSKLSSAVRLMYRWKWAFLAHLLCKIAIHSTQRAKVQGRCILVPVTSNSKKKLRKLRENCSKLANFSLKMNKTRENFENSEQISLIC